MMHNNFDKLIDRRGSDSVKHDLLSRVFGTEDVLPMWVADMDFEVPDCIRNAIRERVDHPVYGYTFRPERFYEIIAGWMKRRHRWNVDPGWISFSPGVVPALILCILAYTEPGDKVLIQPPVYFPFFRVVKDHNRELVYNILVKTNGRYEMDFDELEEEFKSGVRMMLLCHPHNPAGRVWRQSELETLAGLCVKYNVMVVSDEIHSD
ncbi:MAG TPA: aminotransferase class I/II-fold pyridoxal phosphate-dependent enzyme, partial [Bacteroidaceae bacterium]|nr:aminotransferase class I/II-fold pyridoxal phosphate-dependent enzyme [Bacteroidaceae bacterium]